MRKTQIMIACASFVGMTVTDGPIVFGSFAQLFQPVSAEFIWGRSAMPLAFMIAAPLNALLYPIVGLLLDRWGSRRILLIGFSILGLSMAALARLNGSVTQMLVLYVCAYVCSTLPTGVAFGRVIARNFSSHRGAVLGVCLGIGGGLGAAVMPMCIQFLLEHWGWRGCYLGLGLAPMIIGIPAALCLPANDATLKPDDSLARASSRQPLTLFNRTFLLLAATTFLSSMAINGAEAHMAAIAGDHGLSSISGALLLSAYAVFVMAGQFGVGLFLDRAPTPRLAMPAFIAMVIGVLQLQFASTTPTLAVGAALLGFSAGSGYGIFPYFVTRFFGLKSFGLLYGMLYASSALGGGIGSFIMGAVFDLSGSYGRALIGFDVMSLVAVILVAFLPPYVYAADGSLLPDRQRDASVEVN